MNIFKSTFLIDLCLVRKSISFTKNYILDGGCLNNTILFPLKYKTKSTFYSGGGTEFCVYFTLNLYCTANFPFHGFCHTQGELNPNNLGFYWFSLHLAQRCPHGLPSVFVTKLISYTPWHHRVCPISCYLQDLNPQFHWSTLHNAHDPNHQLTRVKRAVLISTIPCYRPPIVCRVTWQVKIKLFS